MKKITGSILITAPYEKVFQYACDYRNWDKWYVGVSDFKSIGEIDHGTGAKYVYKATMFGVKATVGTEIHNFRENEGWTGKSFKGIKHQTEWIFEAEGGNTKFTHILYYKLPIPILGDVLERLFLKPAWEKIIENSLQNLKKIMEKSSV